MTFQQGHLTIIKLFIYLVFIVIKFFLYYFSFIQYNIFPP